MRRQPQPDPVAALAALLDERDRRAITIVTVERATGIPSSALSRRFGGLEGLLVAAELHRFQVAREATLSGSLDELAAASDAAAVALWIDRLLVGVFSARGALARRRRAAVLAATLDRPNLAVAVHPEWAAELGALTRVIAGAQTRGVAAPGPAHAIALLMHAFLAGLVLLDIHPRIDRGATQAIAERYRWALRRLLLAAGEAAEPLPEVESLGIPTAGSVPIPRLDVVGERIVAAAVTLIDSGGERAVKALPLARASGVRINHLFTRFQDLNAVVRLAHLERLLGMTLRDMGAMINEVGARNRAELRLGIPGLAVGMYGGHRRPRRMRRLDALGRVLQDQELVAWAAERHATAVRAAAANYGIWEQAFGLTVNPFAFGAFATSVALGLAQVELVADVDAAGVPALLGDLLLHAV